CRKTAGIWRMSGKSMLNMPIAKIALICASLAGLFAGDTRAQTLRVVPHADLSVLDPTSSSATITADHSYLVYDTLFALDDKFAPQPQMVDTWTLSSDHLVYRFSLRDGLLFHNGAPVTAEDAVASIKRWAAKDGTGQLMTKVLKEYRVIDTKTFEIAL